MSPTALRTFVRRTLFILMVLVVLAAINVALTAPLWIAAVFCLPVAVVLMVIAGLLAARR